MTERRVPSALLLLSSLAAIACDDMPTPPSEGPAFAAVQGAWRPDKATTLRYLADVNAKLLAEGAPYTVERVEWVTRPGVDPASGNAVYTNNRQLRLESRWVPGDERRLAEANNITYGTWLPAAFAPGVGGSVAGMIDAAFDTWADVTCSNLPLVKRTLAENVIPSLILGAGGYVNDPLAADIATIGWIPGEFFDAVIGVGARNYTLGATFTFTFGTDVNADGRVDTAHKEIWYNADFEWSTSGGFLDVASVVLHETGHALELGHFGKIHATVANSKLRASPRAVMNAIILGELREPLGADEAAYCGNFASWPN